MWNWIKSKTSDCGELIVAGLEVVLDVITGIWN